LRDSAISKSEESKAITKIISHVAKFEKPTKLEKSIVDFSFADGDQMKGYEKSLSWIPPVLQNQKLLNIALLYILRLVRSKAKGSKGLLGGNMHILVESMEKRHPGYERVILLNLEKSKDNESMTSLLETRHPLFCDISVGIALYEGKEIVDLILVAKGMVLED